MIIPAPIRALMALYTIIVATEGVIIAKKSGQRIWSSRYAPAGAYGGFVVFSAFLIIDFFLFYFDAYHLLNCNAFIVNNEYAKSGYAIFCAVGANVKNWSGENLTIIKYVKFGIGILILLLAYLYTDMMVNGGYINLLGKIIRP